VNVAVVRKRTDAGRGCDTAKGLRGTCTVFRGTCTVFRGTCTVSGKKPFVGCPGKPLNTIGQNRPGWRHYPRDTNFPERQLAITKDDEMGDKGGKKDKEKSKKQNADKQEQKTKGKPAQPKSK
jgi:hypothetical protein